MGEGLPVNVAKSCGQQDVGEDGRTLSAVGRSRHGGSATSVGGFCAGKAV